MNRNLGAAVSAVNAAAFRDEDYAIARQGDCVGEVNKAQLRRWDAVAQRFGFRNVTQLRAEVASRTTEKWAYHNLAFYGDVN